jgi:GNAT superfamily N-acetyltransferase
VTRGISRHFPIRICLIARLAVDQRWQGRGLGSAVLRDALRRTLGAAAEIGIRAVLVDAIDENAAAFYRSYGFERASADGRTLMVPIAAVRSQLSPRP